MQSLTKLLTPLLFLATCTAQTPQHWVGTWASAQQIPEPNNALAPADLHDATLREVVHVSLGGSTLRVHFSNAFGTQPLRITSAHIAKPTAKPGTIDTTTDKPLTFSGQPAVTIPAGADYLSDPITFPLATTSDLAITFHLDAPPSQQTSHPGSRTTTFLTHGDATASPAFDTPKTTDHWFFLSAVDVTADKNAAAIITFGDSITDGHGSTPNANDRWPDALANILQANKKTRVFGILNEGIGGNHMLTDGLGPNALARFDRDVLAQSGATTVILLEGVNDLGAQARSTDVTPAMRDDLLHTLTASYEQFITRAHTHGLRVIGATVLPYTGSDYYHPSAEDEATRLKLNQWIRTPGHFDAVIDFDKATADPQSPNHLLPAYDCGDHLHPSPAGYRAMATAAASVLAAKP